MIAPAVVDFTVVAWPDPANVGTNFAHKALAWASAAEDTVVAAGADEVRVADEHADDATRRTKTNAPTLGMTTIRAIVAA